MGPLSSRHLKLRVESRQRSHIIPIRIDRTRCVELSLRGAAPEGSIGAALAVASVT